MYVCMHVYMYVCICIMITGTYVTRPTKIDHVSANYIKLYFR